MIYTKEFRTKLKEVYPSFFAWHRMAEEENDALLEEIQAFDIGIITPEEIVESFGKGTEGKSNLFTKAKRMVEQNKVWSMVMDLLFEV